MVSSTSRSLFEEHCSEPVCKPTLVHPCKILGNEEKLDQALERLIQHRQPVLLIDRKTKRCYIADPAQVLRWRQHQRQGDLKTHAQPSSDSLLSHTKEFVSVDSPPSKICSS